MDGLGRVFNVIAVADGVLVPLRDATAVSFVCYLGAGDTFTVQEAEDAAGTGAADLDVVDHYYTSDGVGGAWAEQTQTADAAVTISGAAGLDCAVFTVHAEELSDGFTHVKCTSTSTGTVVAILHDLAVQRTPQNLAALV
ncbi:hypothetical protein D7231_31840 [Streptomyces klenkii]|uniref:Uncharacterized protein n=1 Tax=Streptomyces klenkii TaxID=1420899 RepID=A0A3B0AR87_9ACTN|nr:hypothetical protein [Streptomyces klenkii]RKN61866.1 hypothetical protein D7231_31840 [Streptomyces klenkii]